MKIKWIRLPVTNVLAAVLGKIHIGGISEHKTGIFNDCTMLLAECFLPSVNLSIREFATLKEAKEDFEQAVREWMKKAGLK